MNHIMIDIETLGRSPDAVIVQIAAVQFDPMTGAIGEKISINIDPVDCQNYGLTIDANTVKFWLEQSREAHQSVFFSTTFKLEYGLMQLRDLIEDIKFPIIWGNSPSFDCEILKTAYKKLNIKCPWEFRNERDFRTISKLFPDIIQAHERQGVAHNAIDDCKNQIAILQKCFFRIYGNFMKNTEGVILETEDDGTKDGYKLAKLLDEYPRDICGCTSDCHACINYAIETISGDNGKTEIPFRFCAM